MQSTYSYVNPPRWFPTAVPSAQGWKHPTTGELLVSVPGGIPMVQSEVLNEVTDKSVIDESLEKTNVIDESISEKIINEQPSEEVITEKVSKPKSSRKPKTVEGS